MCNQRALLDDRRITGGDRITARWLNANPVTFAPSHTIFLQTNRKPQAPADDDALWERVKVIEFKVRFVDEPAADDERPRDLGLEPALLGEAPGILAWLVRGHLDYLTGGLQTPASVRLARDAYRKGESIEPFLEDCCAEDEQGVAEGGELYAAYEAWCATQNLRPKSVNWLSAQLRQRVEKGRTSVGRSCYHGLILVRTAEDLKISAASLQEGVRTPQNASQTESFTRFSEDLRSIPDPTDHVETHEGDLLNMPSGSSGSSDKHPGEPPDGVLLVRCDHKGDRSLYGIYHKAVAPNGESTDPTPYPDQALQDAWHRWGGLAMAAAD